MHRTFIGGKCKREKIESNSMNIERTGKILPIILLDPDLFDQPSHMRSDPDSELLMYDMPEFCVYIEENMMEL